MTDYTKKAQDIDAMHHSRMISLAEEFRESVIIPTCKKHGLAAFFIGSAMGGPIEIIFKAKNGISYETDFMGRLHKFSVKFNGPQQFRGPIYDDLSQILRVIESTGTKGYLESWELDCG